MDDVDEERALALIEWVNTFENLVVPVASLEGLSDGVVPCDLLSHIAPDAFNPDLVGRGSSAANWAISLTNLKKVVKTLEVFYREDLKLEADFDDIDLPRISREKDVREIIKLLELIIIAAIRCPSDRARQYVEKIMGMSSGHQAILKACIESAMRRTRALSDGPASQTSSKASSPSQETENLREALKQADEENTKLRQEAEWLKQKLAKASDDEEELSQTVAQQAQNLDAQRKGAEAAEHQCEELRSMYDAARLKAAEKEADADNFRVELDRLKEKAAADREKLEGLEASTRRLADELDVARSKAGEVAKLEAIVEKYKQKLDQAAAARQHIKEMEEQNSKYLDQILSLEDEVKNTVPALRRTVEQYKEKVLAVEREKFKAVEGLQLKDAEISKLREEVEAARDAKRFLTEELMELRSQAQEGHDGTHNETSMFGLFDGSMVDVKERLARLERENMTLRKQMKEHGAADAAGELLALSSQLQDVERVRKEREDELIEARKRIVDLEGDVRKLRAHVEGLEERLSTVKTNGHMPNVIVKEVESLRERLHEEMQTVATLRLEKEKLESFTKRTLSDVQQKYVQTLEGLKNSNGELKERNRFLEERLVKDKAAQKREERLLTSAFYELGLEVIEHRIAADVPVLQSPK